MWIAPPITRLPSSLNIGGQIGTHKYKSGKAKLNVDSLIFQQATFKIEYRWADRGIRASLKTPTSPMRPNYT